MDDELDYNLGDPGNNIMLEKEKKKKNKTIYILISIIIFLVIIIIVGVVLHFTLKSDKNEENQNNIIPEIQLFINISTSENKMIRNSFIKGRENFIEEIGDINDGKDYEENERNNFDLCIPNSSAKNKLNYKTIMLNIHGGGWVGGKKGDALDVCKNNPSSGIIGATMSYTLLNGDYKEFNIFRIIDEITAVLKTLKKFLKEQNYDENKLEVIIQGGSAGAHLSLLYSYMIKNPPIPIKFIINGVGPVTLDPDYWLTIKPGLEPLFNIEPENIREAVNNGSLVNMNGSITDVHMNNNIILMFMNAWLGKSLNDSFDEMFSDINKNEINKDSIIYKERLNKVKYAFPINYVTKDSIPTLCLYSGKDEEIGAAHYSLLKEAFNKKNNTNIDLSYFRYGTHNPFADNTEYGQKGLLKFNTEFERYCKTYLNSFK